MFGHLRRCIARQQDKHKTKKHVQYAAICEDDSFIRKFHDTGEHSTSVEKRIMQLIIQARNSNIIEVEEKNEKLTQLQLEKLPTQYNGKMPPTLLVKLDKEGANSEQTDLEQLCNSLCTGTVLCHLVNILDTHSGDIVPWEPNYLDLTGMGLVRGVATGALDRSLQILPDVPGAKALQNEAVPGVKNSVTGASAAISNLANKSRAGRVLNRALGLAGYKQNVQVPESHNQISTPL
jgi:hypothetical protein